MQFVNQIVLLLADINSHIFAKAETRRKKILEIELNLICASQLAQKHIICIYIYVFNKNENESVN